jgi:hypothetical protein
MLEERRKWWIRWFIALFVAVFVVPPPLTDGPGGIAFPRRR